MRHSTESYDVVVCGAGVAGICAAVSAARHGASVALIGDRPVLGGNSSSEIRVIPRGAAVYHAYARETGIISELLIEERARNHEELFENGWTNSVWDMELYDLLMRTPGLTFHLNTTVVAVETDEREIRTVTGRVANAETEITFTGATFVDCTGDGVVADLAGNPWRMGTEGRAEFDEPHAPMEASDDVMGNSIHIKTRDVGYPVPFELPSWAQEYDDASFFYKGGRFPRTLKGGYWWLEIGVPWHPIYDNERIRHELTRHALGVWDWIKNKDPELKDRAATYALDWIGQVPGKRESRRILGRYLFTEHDLHRTEPFEDEIGYAGWNIDLHTPGGLLAPTSEPTAAEGYDQTGKAAVAAYVGPLGMPLRSFIASDFDNLMMAGRNVSATHVGLGSIRVQATTALMGQAVGTAAAVARTQGISPAEVPARAIGDVQQTLLRDGCFLPNVAAADPLDLARDATVTASSTARVYGVGPESRGAYAGLGGFGTFDPTDRSVDALNQRRGQWIAVETGPEGRVRIDALSVCVSNSTGEEQEVPAYLLPVDHIWDYRVEPATPLATTVLRVPPGERQWVEWPVGLDAVVVPPAAPPGFAEAGNRFVRLDLDAAPEIRWHRAGALEPGQMSAFVMAEGRLRRYLRGATMSFRITPAQAAYEPANVISGESRPHVGTNLWRSDPAEPLAQWLELRWDAPRLLGQVEITFAGNVLRDYEVLGPHYRDPQCARDYVLQARDEDSGDWRELVRVTGNFQRHRRHALDTAVRTSRLRLLVEATNGDPSAAVYEVRCYPPDA